MMVRNFRIETILSITTGINCTSNLGDIYDLACFVTNGNITGGLSSVRKSLKCHLISIYPWLEDVHYDSIFGDLNIWLLLQRKRFGNVLPVCRLCDMKNDCHVLRRSIKSK